MQSFQTYDELYHHGIKGQKWGERRFQNEDGTLTPLGRQHYAKDEKERKRLNRQLAADKKNLKVRAITAAEAKKRLEDVERGYNKTLRKFYFFKKNKAHAINEKSESLRTAQADFERDYSGYNTAKEIYNRGEKRLRDQVDSMMTKYGDTRVKELSTKNVRYGKIYTENVIRTGVTLADIPVIGQKYAGLHVGNAEETIRNEKMKKRLKTQY